MNSTAAAASPIASATALIIDDEADIRALIAMSLTRIGLDCHSAANLEEARNLLANYEFDVCLTDMKLPDGNGVDFVAEIGKRYPHLPIAVITAHGDMHAAVEAMKNGAFDFVSKPVDIHLLRRLVMSAVGNRQPDAKQSPLRTETHETQRDRRQKGTGDSDKAYLTGGERLVGSSAKLDELRRMIHKLGRTNASVWITGESGTGKELIARLIHENSLRAEHSFVPVNCGAIPAELMESEFFGHIRGSFTGATSDHAGLFRAADGGTLFLDEIAELPLPMQVKLLRAIQERTIRPVGDTGEHPVDVRILSASHKHLPDEVASGRFRNDLYYRLNVISLKAAPLRERSEDIPEIAAHILRTLAVERGEPPLALDEEARRALMNYAFPGNVRELQNLLERAMALHEGPLITTADLQLSEPAQPLGDPLLDGAALDGPVRSMGESARQQLLRTLEAHHWNQKEAARALGLTYRQLRYRLEQLGIRP